MEKFFVTTPIYYVNDVPHIGHAYTTVAADVLARWNRLRGKEVFFLTGTDEHGTKIAQAAAAHNREPQAYCDEIAEQFKSAWKALNITNDAFIRTTAKEHETAVHAILKQLWEKGVIFKGRYQGKYCIQCERFYTDEELLAGLCPDHRIKPEVQSEDNYFFRLSQFKEDLITAITDKNHPQHFDIFPVERRNEVIGKLKGEVNDISMSRATLSWGIPLPWDRSQTTYVWVDALVNYLTAIGYPNDEERWKAWWPAQVHLMAKDILWFHTVVWPAMLMAVGLPIPKKVFAHGFFTVNGRKMSKSLGNVIRPEAMREEFGVDGTRFLLLSAFPFGADGDFTIESLRTAYNAHLANTMGNLVSRTLTMLEKYGDGKAPGEVGGTLLKETIETLKPVDAHLDQLSFHLAIQAISSALVRANQFIEENAPWKLAKTDNAAAHKVLGEVLLVIKAATFFIYPIMPEAAAKIWHALGQDDDMTHAAQAFFEAPSALRIPEGQACRKSTPLFPRLVETAPAK